MNEIPLELTVPNKSQLTYDKYLRIKDILSFQIPLSDPEEHDETLFIIIHQVYELWFKQIFHEINFCQQSFASKKTIHALRALNRIRTIQITLSSQIDILETMTPIDFNRFRNHLNPASGFQSVQFRMLEFCLGSRNRDYLRFYSHDEQSKNSLIHYLEKPSFYDCFLKFISGLGFEVPEKVLKRDFSEPYNSSPEIERIFLGIYSDQENHLDIKLLLEAMLDFDQKFLLWRFRHFSMVERMLGGRPGTGGSSGSQYLATTLAKKFFPEIWNVRNLISDLPGSGEYGVSR